MTTQTKPERTYKGARHEWQCEQCDTVKTLSFPGGCFKVTYCKTCKAKTEHDYLLPVGESA